MGVTNGGGGAAPQDETTDPARLGPEPETFGATGISVRTYQPMAHVKAPRQRLRILLLTGLLTVLSGAWAPVFGQIYALPRPDTSATGSFGVSVDVDGAWAVVGASGEDVCGDNSGAAYVYERSGDTGPWSRVARLAPEECRANAFFGDHVALSGNRILISASSEFFAFEESNAAYVFERDSTGTWKETEKLTGIVGRNEGLFAADVALDGDRAVVTTSGNLDGGYGGAVYVFEYRPERDRWQRVARLTASRGVEAGVLGGSVSLDGDRIAVAASTYLEKRPGSVYVFERTSEAWRERAIISGIEDFFMSLDLDGDTLLVGESRAGRKESGVASVFVRSEDGSWTKQATLRPSTPYESGAFGSTVSLQDGWALVTGYDEQLGQDFNIDRVVYAFRFDPESDTWKQRTIIDIGEVDFGTAIDQDRTTALISSVPNLGAGAAYVVQLR